MSFKIVTRFMVALLVSGSAILLNACSRGNNVEDDDNHESLMTQQAEDLVILSSENGRKSYRFQTPLMESYEYAREPYREFRKGIKIETFQDSTDVIESTLIADYAIHFIGQELWEAKGNVVATNVKGQILETQQLFWNQRTKRIYSNIDSKITDGDDVIVGVGFESDESFEEWEFRRIRGQVKVDVEPNRDTTAVERPDSVPAIEPKPAASTQPASQRSRVGSSPRPQPQRSTDGMEPIKQRNAIDERNIEQAPIRQREE